MEEFLQIQQAYMEAIKHASHGVDRTKKNAWVPRSKNTNYNPNRNEPEYTKVIVAENIKSSIDTEAEMNRDPAAVKWRFLILLSLCIMIGFTVLLVQAKDVVEFFRTDGEDLIKMQKELKTQTLEIKVKHAAEKDEPFK